MKNTSVRAATGALLCVSAAACIAAAPVSAPASAQDIADTVALCATCHGAEGVPTDPEIPIIWGQHFYYLYVQLKDYKSGRRANEVMSGIVADLGKEEMQALAKHFSEQAWPRIGATATEADVARAERAAVAGACPECHLANYQGNSGIPRVAGQQPAYLEKTMLELKSKLRQNAPAKATLFATYEDADLVALARFLASR